jgi:hypothetical protein
MKLGRIRAQFEKKNSSRIIAASSRESNKQDSE